jgi:hypothetical protein
MFVIMDVVLFFLASKMKFWAKMSMKTLELLACGAALADIVFFILKAIVPGTFCTCFCVLSSFKSFFVVDFC